MNLKNRFYMKFQITEVNKLRKKEVFDSTKRCKDFSPNNKYERFVGQ
jgi:hypothetical protein